MSILSRLRARRLLDAARAEALLAGLGVPAQAPAGQQALARVLEAAAAPGSEKELAGQVAAAAAFVQVTSEVKPRRAARRALAAVVCAVVVGGTAVYAGVVASPHHNKMVVVPFGVPAAHPHGLHSSGPGSPGRAVGQDSRDGWGLGRSGHRPVHPVTSPGFPVGKVPGNKQAGTGLQSRPQSETGVPPPGRVGAGKGGGNDAGPRPLA